VAILWTTRHGRSLIGQFTFASIVTIATIPSRFGYL
jgi:hypothetical protein